MQVLHIGVARIAALHLWQPSSFVPRPAAAQTGSTLKVLDWNTHHGVGSDGVYNIDRFVPWIVSSGANVVSLNEVEKFTSWGNEDQPARYAAMLQAATGKTWHYTFAQRDGAAKGQGNLILTTFPIAASGQTLLSYSRSVARVQIVVNGVDREHLLDPSRCGFGHSPRHADDRAEGMGVELFSAAHLRGGLQCVARCGRDRQHDGVCRRRMGSGAGRRARASRTPATRRETRATAASTTSGMPRPPRA